MGSIFKQIKNKIHGNFQIARNKLFFLNRQQNLPELCRLCNNITLPFKTAYGKFWYRCPSCNFLQAKLSKRMIKIINKGEGFKAGGGVGGGGYREYWISNLLLKELNLNRILLYGTGNTLTFPKLYEKGIEIWGCDISENLIAFRQSKYGQRFFHIKNYPPIKFHAIIAVEVFEHFLNPLQTIDLLEKHLTEDGIIAGTTDIYDGSDISEHFYLLPPLHISYWSEQSFKKVAATIGRLVSFFELECPGSVYPDEKFGLLWPRKRVFFIYPMKYSAYFIELGNRYPVLPINKP